ncbi:MAG: hypothetical protein LBV42_03575 [Methanobrevibacter sp.]|jgi:hypothetical protein|nr:hypothetical protein [Methanobrevibacter sp.]
MTPYFEPSCGLGADDMDGPWMKKPVFNVPKWDPARYNPPSHKHWWQK